MKRLQWLVFVLAAIAVISRRPDVVLHPQFYAEDGVVGGLAMTGVADWAGGVRVAWVGGFGAQAAKSSSAAIAANRKRVGGLIVTLQK